MRFFNDHTWVRVQNVTVELPPNEGQKFRLLRTILPKEALYYYNDTMSERWVPRNPATGTYACKNEDFPEAEKEGMWDNDFYQKSMKQ